MAIPYQHAFPKELMIAGVVLLRADENDGNIPWT
jgi:hypothetical protein